MKNVHTFESFIAEASQKFDGKSELKPGTIIKTGRFGQFKFEILQDLGDEIELKNITKNYVKEPFKRPKMDYKGAFIEESVDSFEVAIVEGKMKEIFTMAQEAGSYEAFKKEVMKAHPTLKQDASIDEWLKDVFDSAQGMDEAAEQISFDEIKDKYLENPYGIGAQVIEFIEGKNGNSSMLVLKHDDKYRRDEIEKKLKSMGIPGKKMRKSKADSAYKYPYELIVYESEAMMESKMELNSTIKSSNKTYTWIYQTGKDSRDTAVEINKKLNDLGIKSFISKTTGDTVAVPTKDLKKAFDEVISGYDNMKQFDYEDGTKIDKSIVNEK